MVRHRKNWVKIVASMSLRLLWRPDKGVSMYPAADPAVSGEDIGTSLRQD